MSLLLTGCTGALKNRQTSIPVCQPGCVTAKPSMEAAPIIPVDPANAPVFSDLDDRQTLIKAAELNLRYFQAGKNSAQVYDFGDRKITTAALADSTSEFIKILGSAATAEELDRLIKEKFDIYRLAGRDSTGTVVFSAYYEPTLPASLQRTGSYKYPIYARPDDLISVNLEDFNDKFKGEKLSGRLEKDRLVPYLAREALDFEGALDGKGLELAWLQSRADVMDLHIEGSGRLQLEDGRQMKAAFAATNGLKFKGWLTALVEAGALPREGLTHEKGKQYLLDHPEKERAIMSQNKRYTFFRLSEITDPAEGPDGTYGLPLTGWRSIAVDNALVPMGTLAFMTVNTPNVNEKGDLLGRKQDARFVFCQDTGGAIKGPGRVDFFTGNGEKARTFAFKLWDQGALYLLVLKTAPKKTGDILP